jgi:hypothetical protein
MNAAQKDELARKAARLNGRLLSCNDKVAVVLFGEDAQDQDSAELNAMVYSLVTTMDLGWLPGRPVASLNIADATREEFLALLATFTA